MAENKILVVRGGAIGDFILTLPVLAALRQYFPQSRLEVLGYANVAPLAVAGGLADAVRSIDARPLAGFFARGGPLAPELQNYFSGFAVIISYLYDPDGIFEANVASCSKAQFIAGPHRPLDVAGVPAAEVFLKPLERLAIFDAEATPRLTILDSPIKVHPLALHPGSGGERKNWPETHWAGLLRQILGETEGKLLLVGGEAEQGRLERLAALLPAARLQVSNNLPLVELAQGLSQCGAFIGHDSGITHLAAALGLPGLVLWGESVESVWAPPGGRMRIVRGAPDIKNLPVAQVRRELAALLQELGI